MNGRIAILSGALLNCLITLSPVSYAADASRGPDLFQNNCRPCHSVDKGAKPDMYGFNLTLYGINGRPAAEIDGFFYSEAMQNSGIVWDEENLRAFLTDPQAVVPDTRMTFFGLATEKDRDDLIEFLVNLDDK